MCIDVLFDKKCINLFWYYSEKYIEMYNSMDDLPLINEVIYYELMVTADTMKDVFVNFTQDVYKVGKNEMKDILNYELNLSFFERDKEDKIKIREKKYVFFNGIQAYYSQFFYIINNNIFDHTTIRLIDVDFSTKMVNPNNLLYNDITQDEKIMYQVIINYPFIHQAIIECEYLMQKNLRARLRIIEKIILYFGITLITIHIILIILWLKFVSKFKTIFEHNYCKIIEIITNPLYLKTISEAFNSLKQLLKLYEEKPETLILSIYKEKEAYQKNKNEETKKKSSHNNASITATPSQKKNLSNNNQIVKAFQILISCLFILYYIFLIMIIGVIYIKIGILKDVIQYSLINTKIDNYNYGALNAIQFSLLTNVTPSEISKIIYNNESDFIISSIHNFLSSNEEFMQFLENHKSFKNVDDVMDISCQNIKNLNDKSALQIREKFDIDVEPFLSNFCLSSYIMTFNNSWIIKKEIGYLMLKLSTYPVIVPYQQKIDYLSNKELFSLYNIMLFVNRMIRFYMNNQLIPTTVSKFSENYRVAISTFLLINCFLELIIILILFCFVLKKMIELSKIISKFMKFLE